jgi:hypothetical protein
MSLILLLIFAGLILWGLWYLFVKSVAWVFEPIAKYFQEKEETGNSEETNVLEEGSGKVVITVSSLQQNGTHKEEQIEIGVSKKGDITANNNVPKEKAKLEMDPGVFQSLKGKRQIRLICKCPKCRKYTTCYDVDIQNARCTNCNWVNKIDPPMTLEGYIKAYYTLIDPSELDIKNR